MLKNLLKRIKAFFTERCPECGRVLDEEYHGYQRAWGHCHNCGWCSYENYWEKRK